MKTLFLIASILISIFISYLYALGFGYSSLHLVVLAFLFSVSVHILCCFAVLAAKIGAICVLSLLGSGLLMLVLLLFGFALGGQFDNYLIILCIQIWAVLFLSLLSVTKLLKLATQ